MKTGDGDYLMGVEDVRDGRVHLIHAASDLEVWLTSFKEGDYNPPVGAICGVCDRVHTDRGFDGELLTNCIRCQVELVEVYTEMQSRREGG
jgi:hypothetical protein